MTKSYPPIKYQDMPDVKKQEYYRKNREKRLKYQNDYYKENKERIKRLKEIKKDSDPDWAENQRRYNREYYKLNREKIKKQRAKRALLKK
mgnify:CR=1 FL=1